MSHDRRDWITEQVGSVSSLRAEWTPLAEQSGNLFATWEWASTWWRHYGGGGRRQLVLACREASGRTTAILPLCIERDRPVRLARFIGHGPADELGPVCAPADAAAAAAALADVPRIHMARWSVLLAERLPGDTRWGGALPGV